MKTHLLIAALCLFTHLCYAQLEIETGQQAGTAGSVTRPVSDKGNFISSFNQAYYPDTPKLNIFSAKTGKLLFTFSKNFVSINTVYVNEAANLLAFAIQYPKDGKTVSELKILDLSTFSARDSVILPLEIHSISYQPMLKKLVFATKQLFVTDKGEQPGVYVYDLKSKVVENKGLIKNVASVELAVASQSDDLAIIPEAYGTPSVTLTALQKPSDSLTIKTLAGNDIKPFALPGNRFLLSTWNRCGFYVVGRKGILIQEKLENFNRILQVKFDEKYIYLLLEKTENGQQTELLTYTLSDFSFVSQYTSILQKILVGS